MFDVHACPGNLARMDEDRALILGALTVRLSGFYELFKYSFALGDALASPPPNGSPAGDRKPDQGARHIAPGASDNFFGAIVQVGYQY